MMASVESAGPPAAAASRDHSSGWLHLGDPEGILSLDRRQNQEHPGKRQPLFPRCLFGSNFTA